MRILLAAAVAFVVLAGCVRPPYQEGAAPGMPPSAAYKGAWASLEDATIRPGVQVITPLGGGGGAECTSNFLFRSADNATLYLGVAAHCFGEDPAEAVPIGTQVDVVGLDGSMLRHAGKVAYNGWAIDPADKNDFGLVALRSDSGVRPRVNPTMMYYGGPTGIASAAAVTPGTHVITYGHSIQRAPDDPENPREGYVLQHDGGRTTVVTNHPGIQGDSGSGLMTLDGKALGVLSMGTTNPTGGTVANRDSPSVNYYVDLDQALEVAKASDPALKDVEVVTAPLLNGAVLPL